MDEYQDEQPGASEEPTAQDVRRPVLPDTNARDAARQHRQQRNAEQDYHRRRSRPLPPDEVADRAQQNDGKERGGARETVASRRLINPHQLGRGAWSRHEELERMAQEQPAGGRHEDEQGTRPPSTEQRHGEECYG